MIFVYGKNSEKRYIEDMYYVPILKCNILSVDQLIENKYRVLFTNIVYIIIDKYPSKKYIGGWRRQTT